MNKIEAMRASKPFCRQGHPSVIHTARLRLSRHR